jgi:transcriptional regulator with XRE-family HTH domain
MKIAEVLKAWRWNEHLTIKDAAAQSGIDKQVWLRLENGKPVNESNLAAVLRWLLS